ncbi:MAG: hypothetical protein P8Y80_15030 [Acidobacteriota bacterium]
MFYEILTGEAAFQGEDVAEILAAVVKSGVNLDLLPENIHPRIREVLIRYQQKVLKKRNGSICEVQYEIEQVLEDPRGVFVQPVTTVTKIWSKPQAGLLWIAAAIVLTAIFSGLAMRKLMKPEPRCAEAFQYMLPKDQRFGDLSMQALAVSPYMAINSSTALLKGFTYKI